MPDYSQGRIYAIRAPGTNDVYIGSTVMPLCKRMRNHRTDYKRWFEGKHPYTTSFAILDLQGAYIELIEEFPCQTKEQLNKREGEIIRETECVNKVIPGRTREERDKDKRKIINEYMRNYRALRTAAGNPCL